MSRTLAKPVASVVRTDERHQHEIGSDDRRLRKRLHDAGKTRLDRIVGVPAVETHGVGDRLDARKRKSGAPVGERDQRRRGIDLARDRVVAGGYPRPAGHPEYPIA